MCASLWVGPHLNLLRRRGFSPGRQIAPRTRNCPHQHLIQTCSVWLFGLADFGDVSVDELYGLSLLRLSRNPKQLLCRRNIGKASHLSIIYPFVYHPGIHIFTHSFTRPSTHPPIHPLICLLIHLFINPLICLIHPSIYPSIHLSTHLPIHLPICPSIHLYTHPPIHPSIQSSLHHSINPFGSSTHPPTHPSIHTFIH